MCISGAKFKEHGSNISGDILILIQYFTLEAELFMTPSLSTSIIQKREYP